MPIGKPHDALLVAEPGNGSDQGLKFLYVVDKDNKVQYRRIKMGSLQTDGLRVVEGVNPDDWIVVGALQQVRPRMVVDPEQITMPTLETTGQAPSPVPSKPQPPPPGKGKEND